MCGSIFSIKFGTSWPLLFPNNVPASFSASLGSPIPGVGVLHVAGGSLRRTSFFFSFLALSSSDWTLSMEVSSSSSGFSAISNLLLKPPRGCSLSFQIPSSPPPQFDFGFFFPIIYVS